MNKKKLTCILLSAGILVTSLVTLGLNKTDNVHATETKASSTSTSKPTHITLTEQEIKDGWKISKLADGSEIKYKETEDTPDKKVRLGGKDRYDTNIAIANEFVKGNPTDTAILASGSNYPDSLSAAPLTGIYNAPILITENNKLTPRIEAEIKKLNIKHIIIVGGTGVVSENVSNRLKSLGITVERLGGQDRYETSMIIANRSAEKYKEKDGKVHAMITAVPDYKDVLTMAPVSVWYEAPIILVKPDAKKISDVPGLQEFVDKYVPEDLSDMSYFMTYVPNNVQDSLAMSLPNLAPVSAEGNDKYFNNLGINYGCQSELDFTNVVIANGEDFPDALGGGALAGRLKAPIVFVKKGLSGDWGKYNTSKSQILSSYKTSKNFYYLGGTAVVPNGSESRVK